MDTGTRLCQAQEPSAARWRARTWLRDDEADDNHADQAWTREDEVRDCRGRCAGHLPPPEPFACRLCHIRAMSTRERHSLTATHAQSKMPWTCGSAGDKDWPDVLLSSRSRPDQCGEFGPADPVDRHPPGRSQHTAKHQRHPRTVPVHSVHFVALPSITVPTTASSPSANVRGN